MTSGLTPVRRRGVEYLDAPNVPADLLTRSLADVARANTLFGGTRAVLRELMPVLRARRGQSVTLLDGALACLECRIVARHEAGDHTIVVGEVESAENRDDRPLLYYRGGYAQLER